MVSLMTPACDTAADTSHQDWTDGYQWKDEEILRWVSIYQFSRAGPGAAHRIYYEAKHPGPQGVTRERIAEWIDDVPLGLGTHSLTFTSSEPVLTFVM